MKKPSQLQLGSAFLVGDILASIAHKNFCSDLLNEEIIEFVNKSEKFVPHFHIPLQSGDFGVEVGGGFDFFLQYFKLGIELKLGVGMTNIHLDENTYFDNPIGGLRSKVWTFSLTFEG